MPIDGQTNGQTSGGLWAPPMSFYCHLLAQLLLTSYRQPDGDLFGSQNGQIGTQMRPLDGSMRCREVPKRFRRSSRSPAILAARVLRVSAVARRAAAAYGDAN